MEKLDFLIDYLLKENKEIKIKELPNNLQEKKNLWRGLCNIREAKPISEEYLKIERDYLSEELKNKQITDVKDIKTIANVIKKSNLENKEKICLWKGDITTLKIEAIVNAANSQGLGCFIPCHKCIDNCINSASGIQLRLECNKKMQEIGKLQTGKAFITKAYNLPSKFVIHTVGPIIYYKVTELNKVELKNCYKNSLNLAIKNGIKEIAFPCISTGEFKFPKDIACTIAINTVREYLREDPNCFNKIVFNVFTEEDFYMYQEKLRRE